ncbi:MAG: SPFH domain-containing protein, partial [Kiritimatiellia bacterium]
APQEDEKRKAPQKQWGSYDSDGRRPAAPNMRNGENVMADHNKLPDNALVFEQVVEFPSRDGFPISLDMTVEFELLPDNIASIYQNYGDLPQVVDKLLLPQILSISRLKGSAYRAKDFITGDGREKFQSDLTATLVETLGDKKLLIHNALIRHVNVPQQILDPIQQASLATEQDLTNKEKQNTAKKQAELNTETGMIEQRGQEVAQETIKMKAEIVADTEKQVAELQAQTSVAVAEIAKQTALIRADITRSKGEAAAKVIEMVEGEKSRGFQLQTEAFGDPQAYAMFRFAETLNPALKINIMHSGPGTLWTDLDKAMMGNMGGAKVLQDAAQPKPQK